MRPRKVVLLVGQCDQALSERSFLLETRGFCTMRVRTAAATEALLDAYRGETLPDRAVDVVMLDAQGFTPDEIAMVRRSTSGDMSLLCVTDKVVGIDAALYLTSAEAANSAVLIERLHLLVRRKRGPKPRPPVPVAAPATEVAA